MSHRFAYVIARGLRAAPLFLALAGTAALAGCDAPGFTSKTKSAADAAKPGANLSAPGQTTTTAAPLPGGGAGDAQSPFIYTAGLSVSDRIAQACGLAPRTPVMPSFDYDSAALADSDRQILGDVAKCLTEGALKGKSVTLIGRADARGEPEYNMTLGESRANTVNRYLVDLGVGKDRMRTTSRGEMDATGTNEDGWANDRRVDIELAL